MMEEQSHRISPRRPIVLFERCEHLRGSQHDDNKEQIQYTPIYSYKDTKEETVAVD